VASVCRQGSQIENCLITHNSATGSGGGGGGVHAEWGSTIDNCTICFNAALGGGGVFGYINGPIRNTIMCFNTTEEDDPFNPNCYSYLGGPVTYSCISPSYPGEGNIADDPAFADAASGDFRLRAGSPCIDAGTNLAWVCPLDVDGGPRLINGRADIGSCEYRGYPALPAISDGMATWQWNVVTGCTYRFEYCSSLSCSMWSNLTGEILASNSLMAIPVAEGSGMGYCRGVFVRP
jgi:hypothetical protein